ncbi:MAG TPA: Ku protein [Armatimonadota bacterium]|jgi:DNA end-binding protein Ku
MPRALWTGSLVFGLVNVPVRLAPAVRTRELRFHMLRREDGCRLRRRMVCGEDEQEVSTDDTVRGYEIAPDQYLTVESGELEALAPETSHALEITDFVSLDEIDPVYYSHTYYLLPEEGAAQPYTLLWSAMQEARKVAIGRLLMRDREYLVAVRPLATGLAVQVMHYAEEVLPLAEAVTPNVEITDKERKLAQQLLEALTAEFDPTQYHDRYRESVEQLLAAKAMGRPLPAPAAPVEEGVIDLRAALEKSVAQARQHHRRRSA